MIIFAFDESVVEIKTLFKSTVCSLCDMFILGPLAPTKKTYFSLSLSLEKPETNIK